MATINDKPTIEKLIKNNGHFEDDPQVTRIVEYTNAWGGICYGISYGIDDRYKYTLPTEFIREPLVIGRLSYCWECDKEIVMDNTNMLDAKPVCYECKHPIAIKSLDELDSILSGD